MFEKILPVVILAATCIFPSMMHAKEISDETSMKVWVSFELEKHGYQFDGEEIEGGLEKFAADNKLENAEILTIYEFMRRKNNAQRIVLDDERRINEIRDSVADIFNDPESVRVRRVYEISGPSDSSPIICGELNAKNGYGGYVGYTTFYAYDLLKNSSETQIVMNGNWVNKYEIGHVDQEDEDTALSRCILSYSDKAVERPRDSSWIRSLLGW